MSIPRDEFGPEVAIEVTNPAIGMPGSRSSPASQKLSPKATGELSLSGMRGFLVIDNTALGPGKGGIRMTPSVTLEEVFRLARTMTWKNAIAGIPFGGAKAGIKWPPDDDHDYDDDSKKQFVQSFAMAIKEFVPEKYIAGPDVNSGEKEMQWFAEAISDKRSATGKPTDMGGLPHELGSTGFGVAHAARVAAEVFGANIKGATVAIEGFGNVGTFAFKHLEEMGAKIVAVSDSKGNIYLKSGLDYAIALKTKRDRKSVIHYKGAHKLSDDDFWGLPVDIFVTAALTDAVNEKNKDLIRAKIIVEGSNIPMSEKTEDELWRRGVKIVPDFVANAGGVISSYAEYIGLSPAEMFKMVEEKVVSATRKILEESKKQNRNPREVALETAQNIVREKMRA